jgi:inner membrane protein
MRFYDASARCRCFGGGVGAAEAWRDSRYHQQDVDNVTHAFVGAAIAECATPGNALPRVRAAFIGAGVVAANAPDVDLLYTGIAESPLSYLLHHRGHSHTAPGLIALGVLIYAVMVLLPWTRPAVSGSKWRAVALIGAALASHLLLDSANGYGTHLFYPFTSRWFYGDAVFVLEPWLWAILGVTLALNTARLWRLLIVLLTLGLTVAVLAVGLFPPGVFMVMLGAAGAAALFARAWDRRRRAAAALLAIGAIVVVMSGVSRAAKTAAAAAAVALGGGGIVDIVADANPGVPWCWAVLTLQQATNEPARPLTARRATLSLLPRVWPAASCASARLGARGGWSTEDTASDAVVWHRRWRIDVEEIRRLAAGNCRVRAWLQFGRVPYVANGRIADLRFENPIGQNFTPMAIGEAAGACPPYLTDWEWPRRDVLADPSDTSTE